jgi:L-lysine 2,3-aminomutase
LADWLADSATLRVVIKRRRTEMSEFVKVVDLNDQVQVINTRQIVRVAQNHPPSWDVLMTSGEPVSLSTSEAEKLFKTVPVAHHGKESNSG